SGRHADQIKIDPSYQRSARRLGRWLKATFLDAGQDELVDFVCRPSGVIRFGHFRLLGRNVCPMISPLRPLTNPLSQQLDFFWRQRIFLIRHALLRIGGLQPADHLTLVRMARNYCELAGLGGVQGVLPEEKAETAVSLHTTMAGNTGLVENGFDLRIEIDSFVTTRTQSKEQKRSNSSLMFPG